MLPGHAHVEVSRRYGAAVGFSSEVEEHFLARHWPEFVEWTTESVASCSLKNWGEGGLRFPSSRSTLQNEGSFH